MFPTFLILLLLCCLIRFCQTRATTLSDDAQPLSFPQLGITPPLPPDALCRAFYGHCEQCHGPAVVFHYPTGRERAYDVRRLCSICLETAPRGSTVWLQDGSISGMDLLVA